MNDDILTVEVELSDGTSIRWSKTNVLDMRIYHLLNAITGIIGEPETIKL